MVHTGYPVCVHGRLLVLGVLAAIALDLDDKVQGIVFAAAVINADDEVGQVTLHLGAVAVGYF